MNDDGMKLPDDAAVRLRLALMEPSGPKPGERWAVKEIARYLSVKDAYAAKVIRGEDFPAPETINSLSWSAVEVIAWVRRLGEKQRQAAPATLPAPTAPLGLIQNIPGLYEVSRTGLDSAVYFLSKDGFIVYVGQSSQPAVRIAGHAQEGKIDFDRAFVVPVPSGRLNEVESAFIKQFRPPHNRVSPRCKRPIAHVMREFGVSPEQ